MDNEPVAADTIDSRHGSEAAGTTPVHQAIGSSNSDAAGVPDTSTGGVGSTVSKAIDGLEVGQREYVYASLRDGACSGAIGCREQCPYSRSALSSEAREQCAVSHSSSSPRRRACSLS